MVFYTYDDRYAKKKNEIIYKRSIVKILYVGQMCSTNNSQYETIEIPTENVYNLYRVTAAM